jgi:hypothetical protein
MVRRDIQPVEAITGIGPAGDTPLIAVPNAAARDGVLGDGMGASPLGEDVGANGQIRSRGAHLAALAADRPTILGVRRKAGVGRRKNGRATSVFRLPPSA